MGQGPSEVIGNLLNPMLAKIDEICYRIDGFTHGALLWELVWSTVVVVA